MIATNSAISWIYTLAAVSFKIVNGDEDLMIITDNGIIIRLPIDQVSLMGRVTQGVRLINLKENQKVSTVTKIQKEEEKNQEDDTELKEEQ